MSNHTPSSATDTKPSHEQIAARAELLWKAKGSPSGSDEEIWLEAERQLADEARETLSDTSKISSEAPNPAMGSQSSAAEEMRPKSGTGSGATRGSKRKSGR